MVVGEGITDAARSSRLLARVDIPYMHLFNHVQYTNLLD